ncbi:MAG: cytidylate kinase family protein [Candidatus Woesearchaeota archaeon]
MIISISGDAASGKSTVSKLLARKLKYKHYSAGDLQRRIANKMGLTITGLHTLEEKDDSIDRKVDEYQKNLGETKDNFVIDSWLAGHFIPHAFHVYLKCCEKEQVKRRLQHKRKEESFSKLREAESDLRKRAKLNRRRWYKFYSYDYKDMKNYDLVVDTTRISPEQVIDKILNRVKASK